MSRLYKELPCGCMVSEDGGGGYIPCPASGWYDQEPTQHQPEKVELHRESMRQLTRKQRFAEEYRMPMQSVVKLVRLAKRAGDCNTFSCNGDPFPGDPSGDKNKNCRLWSEEVDKVTVDIANLVRPFGFTSVVYTGLGPTLKRGDSYVEIPY